MIVVDNSDGASGTPFPPQRPGGDFGGVLALVNGVLAAFGGTYVATHSILVTVLAGVSALVLADMVIGRR
jgi:hypothetical protein